MTTSHFEHRPSNTDLDFLLCVCGHSVKDGIAIFLCDETGIAAEPWANAGYECYCVDVAHSIRRPRRVGNINFVWGDCRTWRPPEGRRIIFAAGFPPCTHDAASGARDFLKKGGMMLRDSLETFEACRLAIAWSGVRGCIEHPSSVLASIPHIGKPSHYFHPHQYTRFAPEDNYTKLTGIWPLNGFVMPPVAKDDTLGPPDNRIHYMGAAGQKERSASPRGFFRAVFEANRPDAMPLELVA
jgi:hypothetical protein